MADKDDIKLITEELRKVIGTVFFVVTNSTKLDPHHYPLHVAAYRGIEQIESLEALMKTVEVIPIDLH